MELLEREFQQRLLDESLAQAGSGKGRIALVSGEAGIGKTALAQDFIRRHGRTHRVLWGACDPLFTPRPLGPLHDIARSLPEIAGLLGSGANWLVISSSLMEALKRPSPCIVVVEDIHWADEATLDLLKFLGRRIEQAHALLLLTYREDEAAFPHPLSSVSGISLRIVRNACPFPRFRRRPSRRWHRARTARPPGSMPPPGETLSS